MTDPFLEMLANRVANLVADRLAPPDGLEPEPPRELLNVAEVAYRLGVSHDYVYAHQAELGAMRLGDGPKARLRFTPERVEAYKRPTTGQHPAPSRRRKRATARPAGAALLPIAGEGQR